MRVLMVEFKGASDRYSLNLARAICKYNVNLTLVSVENCIREPSIPYRLISIFPAWGPESNRLVKLCKYFSAYLFLIRLAKKSNFRFIHVQYFRLMELDWVFLSILRLLGLRIIYTAHNVLPHEPKRYHKYLFWFFYRICNAVIVTSEFARTQLQSELGIKSGKISVIPIGYAGPPGLPILSKEEARNSLGIPLNAKLILFLGLVREYKGVDILLKAVQIAKDKIDGLKLLVAGDCWNDELLEQYFSLIRKLTIEDLVEMRIGFVSDQDLPKYIGASDIVVIPYKRASGHSGIVFLAYHFSRPVIATKVGGVPDAVKEGKSGYLVSPDDEIELANAIAKAFVDPKNLIKMGRYGRHINQNSYSWDKIGRATIEAYQQLLSSENQTAKLHA